MTDSQLHSEDRIYTPPNLQELLSNDWPTFPSMGRSMVKLDVSSGVVCKTHFDCAADAVVTPETVVPNPGKVLSKYNQHLLLERLNIPIPKLFGLSEDGNVFGLLYIDEQLVSNLVNNATITKEQFAQIGRAVGDMHVKMAPHFEEFYRLYPANPKDSSHCALKFKSKIVDPFAEQDFSVVENVMPEYKDLFARRIAEATEVFNRNPEYTSQVEAIYGDVKADNILLSETGEATFIDPIIASARRTCDLGKFSSRIFLLNPRAFFKGYLDCLEAYNQYVEDAGLRRLSTKEVAHMAVFDMLGLGIARYLAIPEEKEQHFPETVRAAKVNALYCLNELIPELLEGRFPAA